MKQEKLLTLKEIEELKNISLSKLRKSIRCGNLIPHSRRAGAIMISENEVIRYCNMWKATLTDKQLEYAKKMLGLIKVENPRKAYKNKLISEAKIKELDELIDKNLAFKVDNTYKLTKECIEIILNKEITEREYNNLQ